jgi:hypothetical protein
MKANQSNYHGDERVLSIHMQQQDDARPVPVEIKIMGNDGTEKVVLAALLCQPRCGQETREAVASAARPYTFLNS